MNTVESNWKAIKRNIGRACEASGRDPGEVTCIAVTKYVSPERAIEAVNAGITNLGENRVEGALEKYEAVSGRADIHFIGTLQSKKAKKIIGKCAYIHSLDRWSLAEEINKRSEETVTECFVQVNVSGEESKAGLSPEKVEPFIESLMKLPRLRIVGLMTLAPFEEDAERTRPVFRQMNELRGHIQEKSWAHAPCSYLSMGMSNDYMVAVEEGATHIRLGTSLVGE
ncbi:YggS family pyridoxal phosphate-dependent enzyme [Marinococcus halophilus]|uniref:Pyridoxal phosphate homeostasis protein n=1 Tax=Marinococcus halophilus TaxID=1371 RepID=A0A510Y3A9_MARHA|nr:YggS family pyridoxal phosphate-dependent enzyme [Marinococcus halophilus]GEK57321.1 UPF0001 protein YlmE [Marinococcus halophilus]